MTCAHCHSLAAVSLITADANKLPGASGSGQGRSWWAREQAGSCLLGPHSLPAPLGGRDERGLCPAEVGTQLCRARSSLVTAVGAALWRGRDGSPPSAAVC